jgi:predicted  nucleic acid-binding Zn ribbon protein
MKNKMKTNVENKCRKLKKNVSKKYKLKTYLFIYLLSASSNHY